MLLVLSCLTHEYCIAFMPDLMPVMIYYEQNVGIFPVMYSAIGKGELSVHTYVCNI